MNKLPLRLRVLEEISYKKSGHNIHTVMDALRSEYGNERQFHESAFLDHLLSLKESGLIDEKDVSVDDNDKLLITYIVSAGGKEALGKYLPKTSI